MTMNRLTSLTMVILISLFVALGAQAAGNCAARRDKYGQGGPRVALVFRVAIQREARCSSSHKPSLTCPVGTGPGCCLATDCPARHVCGCTDSCKQPVCMMRHPDAACPLIVTPPNGHFKVSPGNAGSLELVCDKGYRVSGTARRFCLPNKQWSTPGGRCVKLATCAKPSLGKGQVFTQSSSDKPSYTVGEKITVRCTKGERFIVRKTSQDGTKTADTKIVRKVDRVCKKNGQFSRQNLKCRKLEPSRPRELAITVTSPVSATLRWKEPSYTGIGGITHYKIAFQLRSRGGVSIEGPIHRITFKATDLSRHGDFYVHTLSGLSSSSDYTFKVIAFAGNSEGKPRKVNGRTNGIPSA